MPPLKRRIKGLHVSVYEVNMHPDRATTQNNCLDDLFKKMDGWLGQPGDKLKKRNKPEDTVLLLVNGVWKEARPTGLKKSMTVGHTLMLMVDLDGEMIEVEIERRRYSHPTSGRLWVVASVTRLAEA